MGNLFSSESECGFCLFMKGGGCRETFTAWENCVKEAEKGKGDDVVEKCFAITAALKECMQAHSDYYSPVLKAEEAAQEEAVRELEREKAGEAAVSSAAGGSDERSCSPEAVGSSAS
ncbi:hypothetical protein Vadar_033027 [Vaccinium darrowii]|uniref:Uncharacterized protein n=1 Tax=Vaccinium darrowii TaxID=229202 RepID=A0ACB7X6F6_9ERIC|nr:hypothetical protein Vadar_033027 [Vaccinium darrowii]